MDQGDRVLRGGCTLLCPPICVLLLPRSLRRLLHGVGMSFGYSCMQDWCHSWSLYQPLLPFGCRQVGTLGHVCACPHFSSFPRVSRLPLFVSHPTVSGSNPNFSPIPHVFPLSPIFLLCLFGCLSLWCSPPILLPLPPCSPSPVKPELPFLSLSTTLGPTSPLLLALSDSLHQALSEPSQQTPQHHQPPSVAQ